ncbi:MAG: hypothetical protein ACE5IP_11470 [Terriglobia bacterium]
MGRLVLAVSLLLCVPLAAQEVPPTEENEAARRLLVYRFQVEPAKFQQFEEAMRDWVEAAEEAGLGEEFAWEVSQSDPFTYWMFQPLTDFRRLDATSNYAQELHQRVNAALDAERMRDLQARLWPAIRKADGWVVESVANFDYEPAEYAGGEPQFAHIDVEQVRPERVADYERLLERLGEILRQAGYPHPMRVYRNVTGPQNTYYIVFAAADREELFEHYRYAEEVIPQTVGAEAWRELIGQWAATLVEFEHYDEIMRPDLSFQPSFAEASEGKPAPEEE